jgi:hypothetical protein
MVHRETEIAMKRKMAIQRVREKFFFLFLKPVCGQENSPGFSRLTRGGGQPEKLG